MKRTPLRSKGQRAKRRQDDLDEAYAEVDRRARGRCEAKVSGVCATWGTDRHHRGKRSVWPELVTHVQNIVLVCRPCHDWIDAHQQEASELDPPMHLWRNVENERLMGLR